MLYHQVIRFDLATRVGKHWEGWELLGARNIWEFSAGGDLGRSRIGYNEKISGIQYVRGKLNAMIEYEKLGAGGSVGGFISIPRPERHPPLLQIVSCPAGNCT